MVPAEINRPEFAPGRFEFNISCIDICEFMFSFALYNAMNRFFSDLGVFRKTQQVHSCPLETANIFIL